MIPISVCIITKNEADKIDRCLSCIKELPFEIVVVDTGSTDNTIEVVRKYTDKIYYFDWCDDFSKARNFSISKATNDWILVLDTDEYLQKIDLDELYRQMEEHAGGIGRILRSSEDPGGETTIDRVERLFDRRLYHYKRPIHEQVLPLHSDVEYSIYPIPIEVLHDGYISTETISREKAERNLRILLKSEKDYPDSYTYFQIGQSYYPMEDFENARKYYEKALSFDLDPQAECVQLLVVNYGYVMLRLERVEEALAFYEKIAQYFSFYADFVFLYGYFYYKTEQYLKAALQFIQATQLTHYHVIGSNSYKPFFLLGIIYQMLGDPALARTFYEKCGNYEPALKSLQEMDAQDNK